MRERRPSRPRQRAGHRTLQSLASALSRHSLVLYMTAILLQRLWALLNADVLQLIRRIH